MANAVGIRGWLRPCWRIGASPRRIEANQGKALHSADLSLGKLEAGAKVRRAKTVRGILGRWAQVGAVGGVMGMPVDREFGQPAVGEGAGGNDGAP